MLENRLVYDFISPIAVYQIKLSSGAGGRRVMMEWACVESDFMNGR